jgi:hypothetical protein
MGRNSTKTANKSRLKSDPPEVEPSAESQPRRRSRDPQAVDSGPKINFSPNDKDRKSKKSKKQKLTLAEQADPYRCYQKSVQCPEHELDFFLQAYRDARRGKPLSLREDFCGTFAVSCDWVRSDARRTAVAVDLCQQALQWGTENNLSKLSAQQQRRVRLLKQDVRKKNRPAVDIVAAQNFSFWIFKTREEVIEYFRAARHNLNERGILVLDMMGGSDCFVEGNEDGRKIGKGKKKFSYTWKLISFNPFNHHVTFAISFRFKDGSCLNDAFVYEWRLWSIPEVREMLHSAGFSHSFVYFEKESAVDDSHQWDVQWERRETAPSHPVWLAYIVAVR